VQAPSAPGAPGAAPPPGAAPAASSGVTMTYYDVEGLEHAILLRAMNNRGPKGFHGYTEWRVSYRYETTVQARGCAVSKVSTRLQGNIILPRWVTRAGAPAELIAHWQRYERALLIHEEGHLDHGRELARALEAELPRLPAAQDCQVLDQAVRLRFDELLRQYQARDREYDLRTGHGKTQGASF
jgi:predicted secreted Zn-dependent protease